MTDPSIFCGSPVATDDHNPRATHPDGNTSRDISAAPDATTKGPGDVTNPNSNSPADDGTVNDTDAPRAENWCAATKVTTHP